MHSEVSSKFEPFCSFIRETLPEWKDLLDSEIKFQLLRGLTNEVYKVTTSKENVTPNPFIFRKFNENPALLDRSLERKLFKELAALQIGPKCYGDNEKYRLEEYIVSQTLFGSDYNKEKIRRNLARATAKFHKIDIPWLGRKRFLPDDLANPEFCKPFEEKCDSDVFEEADKEIIKKMKEITSSKEREFLEKVVPSDDIVLSHNDLSNGNQLLIKELDEVMLIDYEYTGKNFRGFDIGYMYLESIFIPHTEFPYFKIEEKNYPTEEEFKDFIEYYIVFSDMSKEEDKKRGGELIKNKDELNEYIKNQYNQEELQKRIGKLLEQTKIGALVCSFYITTWATKMYKTGSGKFGYFEFAKGGFKKYCQLKEEILESQGFKGEKVKL